MNRKRIRRLAMTLLEAAVIGGLLVFSIVTGVVARMAYADWQLNYWDEMSSPGLAIFAGGTALLGVAVGVAIWIKSSLSPCRWLRHCAIRI